MLEAPGSQGMCVSGLTYPAYTFCWQRAHGQAPTPGQCWGPGKQREGERGLLPQLQEKLAFRLSVMRCQALLPNTFIEKVLRLQSAQALGQLNLERPLTSLPKDWGGWVSS